MSLNSTKGEYQKSKCLFVLSVGLKFVKDGNSVENVALNWKNLLKIKGKLLEKQVCYSNESFCKLTSNLRIFSSEEPVPKNLSTSPSQNTKNNMKSPVMTSSSAPKPTSTLPISNKKKPPPPPPPLSSTATGLIFCNLHICLFLMIDSSN